MFRNVTYTRVHTYTRRLRTLARLGQALREDDFRIWGTDKVLGLTFPTSEFFLYYMSNNMYV